MTTDIDWGTVLLDTVKELAAQPGGEPWTAVANGLVKLLEEHATTLNVVTELRASLAAKEEALRLILPLAKGYAAEHLGSTWRMRLQSRWA